MQIAITVGVVLYLVFHFWRFRIAGLLSFFALGFTLQAMVITNFSIPWSTQATGVVSLVTAIPIILWAAFRSKQQDPSRIPARYGTLILLLALVGFGIGKWVFERTHLLPMTSYEYYKGFYWTAYWGGGILLGAVYPLTQERLRRLLVAFVALGTATAVAVLVSYLSGQHDFSPFGARYSPAQRAGGLGIALQLTVASIAVLAYGAMTGLLRPSVKRNIVLGGALGLMAITALITGSRTPLVVFPLALLCTLYLMGMRRSFRIFTAVFVFGLVLVLLWNLLPEVAVERLFGGAGAPRASGLGPGIAQRWDMVRKSFNVLDVAPLLGRTLRVPVILESYIGEKLLDWPHNITLEIMINLGLVGLLVWLMVLIPTTVRWLRAARSKVPDIRVIGVPVFILFFGTFLVYHAEGALHAAKEFWIVIGLMIAHPDILALARHGLVQEVPTAALYGVLPQSAGSLSQPAGLRSQ